MSTLKLAGLSRAEDRAMLALLGRQGVQVARDATEVPASQLAEAGIDVEKLESAIAAAGHPGALDIAALRQVLPADSKSATAANARQAAELTVKSVISLAESCARDLTSAAATAEQAGLPREQLVKLQAMAQKIRRQLDTLNHADETLQELAPEDFARIYSKSREVVVAHAALSNALASHLESVEGERPPATFVKLLDDLRSDAVNVGGWGDFFATKAQSYANDEAEVRAAAKKTMPDVDITITAKTDYGYTSPHVVTKGDLDLHGKQLVDALGGSDDWDQHDGNLDLSDNMLSSPWALPAHVTGDLNLSNNAFKSLRILDMRDLVVDGDLDLSNNRHLRSLQDLDSAKVGGNLNLVGVPATEFLGYGQSLELGGKVLLDASQTALIRNCEQRELPFEIVSGTSPKSPDVPEDPKAALADLSQLADLDRATLDAWTNAVPWEEREALASQIAPKIASADPGEALAAMRVVNRLDHKAYAAALKPLVEQIPTDPTKPLPEAIADLPLANLNLLSWAAKRADLDESRAARLAARGKPKAEAPPTFPRRVPRASPRAERLYLLLRERARSGEQVSPTASPMGHMWRSDHGFDQQGNSVAADVAMELTARRIDAVRPDKGELMVDCGGTEIAATDLLPEFMGYAASYEVMERVAMRSPTNEAFWKLYEHMIDNRWDGGNVTVGGGSSTQRTAEVREHVDALAAPTPALAAATGAVRGLSAASTGEEASAAAETIRQAAGVLSNVEAGALIDDIYTQDRWELARGDGGARVEMISLVAELADRLDDTRADRQIHRAFTVLTDVAFNAPAARDAAFEAFPKTLAQARAPWSLGWAMREASRSLGQLDGGKAIIDAQIDNLLQDVTSSDPAVQTRGVEALEWLAGRSPKLMRVDGGTEPRPGLLQALKDAELPAELEERRGAIITKLDGK